MLNSRLSRYISTDAVFVMTARYRSAPKISSMWRLKSISGEASDATEVSSKPGPDVGPEMVVQAQLEALR